MLPAKWTRQANLFRPAQISTVEWMNSNISTKYMKSKYVRISLRTFRFFFTVLLKIYLSVRTVFQSESVLKKTNNCNMVISWIKTKFYTECMKRKYGWITNTSIKFFTVFKKWILAILIHFAWGIHSASDINIQSI